MIARSAFGTFIATDERLNQRRTRRRIGLRSLSGSGSSMLDPSSDVIMLEQPAFTGSGAALFNLRAEPLVVVDRARQQVERHLVGRAASLGGQARQLCFEFGRN